MLLAVAMVISILPVQTEATTKVKINKTKTTIYVGSITMLKISGTKIIWNKKILTVSNCVKAVEKGIYNEYKSLKISCFRA